MSQEEQKNIDPLADLDDDLGDDWESAFQSEDFMFSPDEEANDFFLFDENDSDEDIDELSAIMENAEQEAADEQQTTSEQTQEQDNDSPEITAGRPALVFKILDMFSTVLLFFKGRPLYQRALAAGVPCLLLLILFGVFFLRQTSEEFAQTKETEITIADVVVEPKMEPEIIKENTLSAERVAPPVVVEEEPAQTAQTRTIRKQWDFPTFTIVSSTPHTETLFININLSLIAVLPEGAALPEEKNVLIKDIIYQFYQNRSPTELKHFALARGEMIHKLHSWLKKEWPDSPINTVIFSKYQVIRTPQTS
jgi:hypothetical protein